MFDRTSRSNACPPSVSHYVASLRIRTNEMATEELRELRHKFKVAYTRYLSCVQMMSDASEKGVWPPREATDTEEAAYEELRNARQALWRALHRHTRKPSRTVPSLESRNSN